MKKFFIGLLAVLSLPLMAQVVSENELALVYYMPKTEIVFEIQYDEITTEVGPFYQYSERYLGTKDVVLKNETYYTLTDVELHTRTVADTERAYKVLPQKGMQTQLLSLTPKGILYGYNVEYEAPTANKKPSRTKEEESSSNLMPLMEEQMTASSIGKMAEGAAKQIYRIRETRMNILAGEVEHAPADGMAMKQVMAKLDEQEEALTRLFIGRRMVKKMTYTIPFSPACDIKDMILYRFSKFSGPVPMDDLSGEQLALTVTLHRQTLASDNGKKSKVEASPICYNLPGSVDISLRYGKKMLIENQNVAVAQLGISIPLSMDLFTQSELPHIRFNTQTGNILSISK